MLDKNDLSEVDLSAYTKSLKDFLASNGISQEEIYIPLKKSRKWFWAIGKKNKEKNRAYPKPRTTIRNLGLIEDLIGLNCTKKENGAYVFEFEEQKGNKRKLWELATKLAINLIDVSTPFGSDEPHRRILSNPDVLKNPAIRDKGKRERYILITGAGISNAVTKGAIPLADEASEIIKKRIVNEGKILAKLIDDELKRLSLTTRLDIKEFETKLLAYSKFAPEIVKEELKKMCRFESIPNLEYEILAHMLKHRFFDVVLNFNFDEIFDDNFIQEISNGDCRYIISDGHCPDEYSDLLIGNRMKTPVFIKPHGTISHSNTLRFTRESLSTIPLNIKRLIDEIIAAEVKDEAYQDRMRINFVLIGFDFKNPLLLESLKDYLGTTPAPPKPIFWIFDKKNRIHEFEQELPEAYRDKIEIRFFRVTEQNNLKVYLKKLWGEIVKAFDGEKYRVTGIERHLIVNEIFNLTKAEIEPLNISKIETNSSDSYQMLIKENLKDYFKDRIYVELALEFLSSDGILNLNQIMNGRVGYYIGEYEKKFKKDGDDDYEEATSVSHYCERIGLVAYKGFISDAYTLADPKLLYDEALLVKSLLKKLVEENLSHKKRAYLRKKPENKKALVQLALQYKHRNGLRINTRFTHPNRNLFPSISDENILNTSLRWHIKYRELLEKWNDWDIMLAISEKGRFLPFKNTLMQDKLAKKRIGLILSSYDLPEIEDINPKDKDRFNHLNLLPDGKVRYLPWWQHNRHMVIFIKKKKEGTITKLGDIQFKGSFYYEHRMLTKKINPIFIESEKDQRKLLDIFTNYWFRAKFYSSDLADTRAGKEVERSIRIIKNEDHLREVQQGLLKCF